jgi:hypothetical protein
MSSDILWVLVLLLVALIAIALFLVWPLHAVTPPTPTPRVIRKPT